MKKSIVIGALAILALATSPLWAAMATNAVGGMHGTWMSGHWNGMYNMMHGTMHDTDRNSVYPCEQPAPGPHHGFSGQAQSPEPHAE
jgi:hypothetical protein